MFARHLQVHAIALAAYEEKHSAGFQPLSDIYHQQSIIGCGVVATDAEEDMLLCR